MRQIQSILCALGVAGLLALTASPADARWDRGGPRYAPGWGHPYLMPGPYRSSLWDGPYEHDPAYRYAPARVRIEIRRAYRGPDHRWRGQRLRYWW